ncbi:MAG TPA: acyltransferase family protein, partial [Acidimicrobiales bacterium]|nr:acyltransferase family protein [Acidimicrobiales bacterium]
SILGIMANHGGFGWAGGGVISVNVFFVLSGFLITMLLLKEWGRSGTIRLRAFWARRARRLLPALFVLLGGIGLYATFFAPDGTQSLLRGDGIATLFYVANWHEIVSNQSYFAQVSAPSPLLHTWTLAIEEQFYLVWPLVVLGVLRLARSRRALFVVATAGVLASAAEMALLFHTGGDPSRIYYGTDTRAQDILTGAAMAILLEGRPAARGRRAKARFSALAAGAAAVFVLQWEWVNASRDMVFRGGFLLADVMVALVICGVTMAPGGIPARALGVRPLAYVGRISYGLYLWHWPVFLVVDQARTGLAGYPLFGLRLAVTFLLAVVSWYVVETPVRQMTFSGWRSWSWVPVGAAGAAGVLFVTTSTAGAAANVFVPHDQVRAQVETYEHAPFPGGEGAGRVLFVGDSLSLTVGFWLTPYADRYHLVLRGRPLDGCGLVTAEPHDLHGQPTYPLAPCARWPSIWASDVATLRPQVVVLVVGWWETMDRWYQGRWQHLGDPAFDAYERAQLEEAVSVLGSAGARVAITTAPYFDSGEQPDGRPWDEDDPGRVDLLNRIVLSVAAEHRHLVTVIPLNRYLDPGGRFRQRIDGQVMRFGDGVHTTEAAGTYLAPKLLPQLASLAALGGRQVR